MKVRVIIEKKTKKEKEMEAIGNRNKNVHLQENVVKSFTMAVTTTIFLRVAVIRSFYSCVQYHVSMCISSSRLVRFIALLYYKQRELGTPLREWHIKT